MPQLTNLIMDGLVIAGAGILSASLVPVGRLIKRLTPGRMRRKWYLLAGLIVFFIAGYLGFALAAWNGPGEPSDLVVSLIFFCGACFVWLVNSLSLQTALDVHRISLLEQDHIIDPLVGICNRRYLDRRLEEEFERARRYGLPLSILMIEVDQFADINETYGRQVGDLVLKSLCQLILKTVRNTDVVARHEGEEVCIIATNTLGPSAVELAERLRQIVADAVMVPANSQNRWQAIGITISIGVAGTCRETTTSGALVEDAGNALQRAKSGGGNRVVVSDGGRSGNDANPPG